MKIVLSILLFLVFTAICRADGLYSVYVFYKGYLTDEEKATVKKLEDESKKGFFNFKTVNPSSSNFDWKDYAVWKLQDQKAPLPRIVLRFPETLKIKANAWDASFTDSNTSILLASERRDEIARLLRKKADAVWIFAGSGRESDSELEATLKAALADVVKTAAPKRKLYFPVVVLAPEARGESVLFSTLARIKGNHDSLKTPALIPLIGKGQVVSILPADQITNDNIIKTCEEIIAEPTSEKIKKLSPDEKIFLCLKWGGGSLSVPSGKESPGKNDTPPAATVSPEASAQESPGADTEKSFELTPPGDKLSYGSVSFQRYYSFILLVPFCVIMFFIFYAIARSDKKPKR